MGWSEKEDENNNNRNKKAFFRTKQKSRFITLIFKWLFILSERD